MITDYTRPIFYGEEHLFCKTMQTPVASDKCWECPNNKRRHYDPSKPKYSIECLAWPKERFTR